MVPLGFSGCIGIIALLQEVLIGKKKPSVDGLDGELFFNGSTRNKQATPKKKPYCAHKSYF